MTDSDHLGLLLQLLDKKDSAEKDLQEAETKLVSIKSRGKNKTTARNYRDICKAELDSIVNDEQELRKRMLERKSKEDSSTLLKTVSGSPEVVSLNEIDDSVQYESAFGAEPGPGVSTKLKLPKPEKFPRKQDFGKFCDNFLDYVQLGQIRHDDLYLYFLSLLDDFTKDKLKTVTLTQIERGDAKKFLQI